MNDQEQSWIQAARSGDEAAFGELVRLYQKRVFALAVRMCPTPELAEEAAQEAFLAAWQGLPFFRGDSAFATWLYRLTSNACVDLLRKENRHQGPSLDDETVSAGGSGSRSHAGEGGGAAGIAAGRSRRDCKCCPRSTGRCWSCGRSSSSATTRSPTFYRWIWGR